NIIACKKHPELKEERSYQKFIQFITENNVETIKRDATRKFLHVFMFSIVVGLYVFATMNKSLVQDQWGFINYWAFCKFFYTFIAYAFNNMFTLADLVRNNKFYWLPNWARKWFSTSIDPREGNTFISSIPYVLTLSLFQFAPPQILFIATSMSTFADASASLFGRAFGKHHFPEKLDSKKTYEGLIAGALAAFLSTALILVAFPLQNQNYGIIVMVGTVSTMVFIIIDMFIQKIADNITNVLFAGLASWLVIIMMGGLF
ncbi:MAG: phosphatidate cytidylyltransferase, partial [Promethearchaeota archaeon]